MAEPGEPRGGVAAGPRGGSGHAAWIVPPLAAFLTANSALWLLRDLLPYPPAWDQANYLTMSLRFWHGLQEHGLSGVLQSLSQSSAVWPPLFPLTTVPLYALFGESRLVAHLANGLYLVVLLLAVQSLATACYGRKAGLLAAVLICGFSDVVRLSRDYLLDFPASALLAAGMAALVRSADLRRRGATLAFGVAVGLTALTKTMTGVFFLAPLAGAAWRRWRAGELRPALAHLALAVLAAALVAAPWWIRHFGSAFGYLVHYGVGAGAAPYATGGRTVLGLRNLTYYGWVLVNNAISFPTAALAFALLAARVGRRLRGGPAVAVSAQDGALWTWFLAGYAILTLVPNKGGDRYALFLLPPVVVLYAGWLCDIARPKLRRGLVALALALTAFNYAAQTWGFAALPRLAVIHPVVFLQQDYPQLVWMRASIPLSAEVPWPAEGLPGAVGERVAWHRAERARVRLRLAIEATSPLSPLTPDAALRLGYRSLLEREPGPDAGDHLQALRSGSRDAESLLAAIAASDEFRKRPVRVLVAPDHPVINAATLDYYAEVARLPVAHAHVNSWPAPGEPLSGFDAALLKEGGWQGPDFTTVGLEALRAELLANASGYRRAGSWPCPDGSRLVLLVRG